MVSQAVSEKAILDELHQVPASRWEEVLVFLRSLRSAGRGSAVHNQVMTAADLLQSGLVGIWADRTDIGESIDFARQLREQAQSRDLPK